MSDFYTYPYPRPSLTVDIIVVRYNLGIPEYLLIKRKLDPFKDKLALPGGFVNENERTIDAVVRETKEETGLELDKDYLQLLGIADKPNRDPRGWVVSTVYHYQKNLSPENTTHLKASDDAKELLWVPKYELSKEFMAFDHYELLTGDF